MRRGLAAETAPPLIAGGFVPSGLDQGDDPDECRTSFSGWEPKRLAGESFGIEYAKADGERSVRRITAMGLRFNDGFPILQSWCHERNAFRSFRLDRIGACYDGDGEVFDVRDFFARTFGIRTDKIIEIVDPEDVFGDGLRLLAALARVDGDMHSDEIERIVQYCAAVYDSHQANLPADLDEALPRLVLAQRPTSAVVDKTLRRMRRGAVEHRRLFARYAVEVMDADGVQHPDEFAMVGRLRAELQGAT